MVYSTGLFVFSIAMTSIGKERANLSAFGMFVRLTLVWLCRFPLPPGVWEGLRFVIVAFPGHFSYLVCNCGNPGFFFYLFLEYQLRKLLFSELLRKIATKI